MWELSSRKSVKVNPSKPVLLTPVCFCWWGWGGLRDSPRDIDLLLFWQSSPSSRASWALRGAETLIRCHSENSVRTTWVSEHLLPEFFWGFLVPSSPLHITSLRALFFFICSNKLMKSPWDFDDAGLACKGLEAINVSLMCGDNVGLSRTPTRGGKQILYAGDDLPGEGRRLTGLKRLYVSFKAFSISFVLTLGFSQPD